jgi:hypothetical protein
MQNPKLVYLSSYDSLLSTDTPANCHLKIQGIALQGVEKITLVQFLIPNVLYNVLTGVNDRVCWNRSSTNYNFQIPAGQYSITSLLSAIQTGMNAADSNSYTLTYSSSSFLVTVAGTGAFTLNWSSNPQASTGCYQQLGFMKTDTSSATSQTGSNVVDLSIPEFIFMDLNELPGFIGTSSASGISNKNNFIIPLYQSGGNLVFVSEQENIHEEIRFNTPINISSLTIQLRDKNGSLIDTKGANWHAILEMHYVS